MSSLTPKEKRIQTLMETQANRKEKARQNVDQAIDRLKEKGRKINFHSVAKEANVSVSYLYKYSDLKARIMELRTQLSQQPSHRSAPTTSSSSSSQVKIINRLKTRISQLEDENQSLKEKTQALAGQVYRVHSLQEQVVRQQQTIENLEIHLEELKEQLSKAKITPISTKQKNRKGGNDGNLHQ